MSILQRVLYLHVFYAILSMKSMHGGPPKMATAVNVSDVSGSFNPLSEGNKNSKPLLTEPGAAVETL